MANQNRAAGFIPFGHVAGGTPMRARRYKIASGLAQSLYSGDPVTLTGTTKNITIHTAGSTNLLIGIFGGCQYVDSQGNVVFSRYWLTGTTHGGRADEGPWAFVYDDPDAQFVVQVSAAAGLVAADLGSLAAGVAGAGSNVTGTSGWMLDQTTIGSAQDAFRIIDLAPWPDNEFGQYAKALVSITPANHLLRSTTAV
jgi:hypothetical protein